MWAKYPLNYVDVLLLHHSLLNNNYYEEATEEEITLKTIMGRQQKRFYVTLFRVVIHANFL